MLNVDCNVENHLFLPAKGSARLEWYRHWNGIPAIVPRAFACSRDTSSSRNRQLQTICLQSGS